MIRLIFQTTSMLVALCWTLSCGDAASMAPTAPTSAPISVQAHAFDAFVTDVQPILLARCANPSCHGRPDRPFALYMPGAHRADPGQTFSTSPLSDAEVLGNYDRSRSFATDWGYGALLLTKPLARRLSGVRHLNGGDVFESRLDREFQVLERWVNGERP